MAANNSIHGKWALVTGASRGIGRQIALRLAGHGCNVIVHSPKLEHAVDTVAMVQRYGVQTHSIEGDLSSFEAITRLIQSVRKRFEYIDILYNNAAVSTDPKPFGEFTHEGWKTMLPINLFSMIMLCNGFAPGMAEQGYGRIVNLTSGIRDEPRCSPYIVSKAAVSRYTQDLGYSLQGTGVLVNHLDLGLLRTNRGGPHYHHEVNKVLPGVLLPVLQRNEG